jgi:hypothetical protein
MIADRRIVRVGCYDQAMRDNPECPNRAASPNLEQWCRALAAHAMLTAHNDHLHSVMAPEMIEGVAQFILRFALGEPLARPNLRAETDQT